MFAALLTIVECGWGTGQSDRVNLFTHQSLRQLLNYAAMAGIPKRNVYVFSPSDGAPVAGKLHGSSLFLISALRTFHQAFISMGVFRFQHSSVGSAKSVTLQKHGLSIYANSTTIVLSVARHSILAVPWRFHQDATSYDPQPPVRSVVTADVLLLTLEL